MRWPTRWLAAALMVLPPIAIVAAPSVGLPVSGQASPRVAPAETYASVCAACHGAHGEGNAQIKAPPIAGQYDWYLLEQLRQFRAGKRGADADADPEGATMRGIASTLDAADLPGIAAYVASMPAPPPPDAWPQGNAVSGRGYFEVCGACHGATGDGNAELKAPRIHGLPGWYLVGQLTKFRQGSRGGAEDTEAARQMKPMADLLTSESAQHDVANYLTSVR